MTEALEAQVKSKVAIKVSICGAFLHPLNFVLYQFIDYILGYFQVLFLYYFPPIY